MSEASDLRRWAAGFHDDQAAIARAAARAALSAWRELNLARIVASWRELLRGRVLPVVTGAQLLSGRRAANYVDRVRGGSLLPEGRLEPVRLAGVASDGRPLDTLLSMPAVTTLRAIDHGARPRDAAALGATQLDMIVRSEVTDTGRVATGVEIAATPTLGYVRMLSPPSCSRCAVLAGRFYRWNSGFLRHPRCQCVHIPASEDVANDIRTNPRAYFDSLSEAEQRRIFTVAGAQAIRDGADIGQVVNARRGMATTAAGRLTTRRVMGRDVFTTTEGTARQRRRGARPIRLMPEQIYLEAGGDREEAVRLLRLHGYLRGSTPVDGPSRGSDRELPRRRGDGGDRTDRGDADRGDELPPEQAGGGRPPVEPPGDEPPTVPGEPDEPHRPSIGDLFEDSDRYAEEQDRREAIAEIIDGEYAGFTVQAQEITFQRDRIIVEGNLYHPDAGGWAGVFQRVFHRNPDGSLVAYHGLLDISRREMRGQGFSRAFNGHLIDWYRQSGVDRIELNANIDVGGYAWAREGYEFATDEAADTVLGRLLLQVRVYEEVADGIDEALEAGDDVSDEERRRMRSLRSQVEQARSILERAEQTLFGEDDFPTAYEISQLGRWAGAGRDDEWIGKSAMLGSNWDAVRYL